ncbi:MAG: hypothetical protein GWO87_03450 [Xanthomonadaceae bacterium]|nr:hypothetical protein [Rhodospirillaceae bacterium]NIA18217.1 hypothetical protein [Xanthomonadaceae bacterium]
MISKNFFKFFLKNKIVSTNLIISIIINFSIWINLLRIKKVDEMIPLHYNVYFGIDYIGGWHKIFILPSIGLIILFINFLLALLVYYKDKFISYILIFSVLFIQIILFLASLSIVWINI